MLATFPSPAGMLLTKLSLGGYFPARDILHSDVPAGDGNVANLFHSVMNTRKNGKMENLSVKRKI